MVLLPSSAQRSGAAGSALLRDDAANSVCGAQYFRGLSHLSCDAFWSARTLPVCVPGSMRCTSGGGRAAIAASSVRGALRTGGDGIGFLVGELGVGGVLVGFVLWAGFSVPVELCAVARGLLFPLAQEEGGVVQEKHHHHHHMLTTTAVALQLVRWRCGYAGVRVGEAAHPGPVAVSPAKPQTPSAARRLRAAPGWENSVVTAGMSPAVQRRHWSVSRATWSESGFWKLKRQSALRSWRLWAAGSSDRAVMLHYGMQSHSVLAVHSAVHQWREIAAIAQHRKQRRHHQQQQQHSSQRLGLQQQVGELQWKVQLQQQFIEEQTTAMAELRQQVTQLQQQVLEQQWHRPHDAGCRCRVCVLELQQEKSSSIRSRKDRKNLLYVLPSPLPAMQQNREGDSNSDSRIADRQSDGGIGSSDDSGSHSCSGSDDDAQQAPDDDRPRFSRQQGNSCSGSEIVRRSRGSRGGKQQREVKQKQQQQQRAQQNRRKKPTDVIAQLRQQGKRLSAYLHSADNASRLIVARVMSAANAARLIRATRKSRSGLGAASFRIKIRNLRCEHGDGVDGGTAPQ